MAIDGCRGREREGEVAIGRLPCPVDNHIHLNTWATLVELRALYTANTGHEVEREMGDLLGKNDWRKEVGNRSRKTRYTV